jgi:hypothetical protein
MSINLELFENENLRKLKKHDNFLAELRLELTQSNKFLSEDNSIIEGLSQKVTVF